ncbi:hypothetical protein BCU74_03865 [Vibrio breoganii]|uniref:DnaB-like helicase C-terminal domain-containing protein n=1 Tax=Vibrio breoganii TaxID=553239 RepID=UPI000C83AC26|nr:DnaB-like helicase C-terminal domain-containing protein [Vibrio breoganii]PMH22233.1 hypothetical protein BCU74_03865 [Vibrio breoganii]
MNSQTAENEHLLPVNYHHDSETGLIGHLIHDVTPLDSTISLRGYHFKDEILGRAYDAIRELQAKGSTNTFSVIQMLEDKTSKPMGYWMDCIKYGGNVARFDFISEILNEYRKNEALEVMKQTIAKLENPLNDLTGATIDCIKTLTKLSAEEDLRTVKTTEELGADLLNAIDNPVDDSEFGISTGFPELDSAIGSRRIARGEITIIGGISKNGKTLLANTITGNLDLKPNEKTLIFSAEMSSRDMFSSIVGAGSGVRVSEVTTVRGLNGISEAEAQQKRAKVSETAGKILNSNHITIDDRKRITPTDICTTIKHQAKLHSRNGFKLSFVLIDHLHRIDIDVTNESRTYAIREAVRQITNTAKELDVAVVLLSQLKQEAEGVRPMAKHILDSGSVKHELQAFIGVRKIDINSGNHSRTFFVAYADAQRFADEFTNREPVVFEIIDGVLQVSKIGYQNFKELAIANKRAIEQANGEY